LRYHNGKGYTEMDTPGRELPKEWRAVATELVRNQGWRYEYGKNHAKLYPADKSKSPITFATTASDHRAFKNFVAACRRAGGQV
jgi:hypothetical protein